MGDENKEGDGEDWSFGLFGCMDDWKLCLFTFLVPCYTLGRNAQFFEEDGVEAGIYYGLCCLGIGPILRWRLRLKQNLKGSMTEDAMLHMVCPCCALIQENKQIYGLYGSHFGERTPLNGGGGGEKKDGGESMARE